ncbi:uncharacterized protein [Medicago truncatula]|uniref:uncharacterized protein n=1 Tax=Medicago truncatula TaxID=3880 RepID=UPI001967D326|nr:uncharacterized protein LOC120577006 [Medicago truncatula]
MDHLEQENHKLREEVTTLRAENEILRNLVSLMTVAQRQPLSHPIVSTQAHTVASTTPISTVFASTPQHAMVKAELEEKFDRIQFELKALCAKELFGKNAYDLCLVPNVVIPPKFKVPDFEKYKGNTCPELHLVMYVRKMSAQVGNDELLIHCFQDSLTGAALIWYMGLNKVDVKTFNDLCEAFVQRFNYNLHLTMNDNESFKAYAQRWRDVAAQVRPPLEEKEFTEIFLETLDQSYYEHMLASASGSFAKMMTVGMRVEEWVRKRRLVKESVPADDSEYEDQEMSVIESQPQQQYLAYHPAAAVMPITNVVQNSSYQPQFQPYQQQYQQKPRQQAPRTKFDPIPMKYAELFPDFLKRNLVQTKPPPPMPKKLPARFRADLSFVFHQGALGHDIERCYAFKNAVQDLFEAGLLPF